MNVKYAKLVNKEVLSYNQQAPTARQHQWTKMLII